MLLTDSYDEDPQHWEPTTASDLDVGAVMAFSRMVDGIATLVDLQAYRAWITYHRLAGVTEDDLASTISLADGLAMKLGVE